MAALPMIITDAGWDAIVDAQNGGTDAVEIVELGLTAAPFVMAPTLTALPGEFRRIDTVGGQAVSENIIHVVAYDPAPIEYDVTGFGLFSQDGTLIAVYSAAADPIMSKAVLATSLFTLDIRFANDVAAVIEFGDPLFLNPPATETVVGVVKLATAEQADEAEDDSTAMTPAMVQRMIDNALRHKIMLWSGAVVDIPEGWLLCDGDNGTPDLRNNFVVGAGGAYAVGAAGGSVDHDHDGTVAYHALTLAQMPAHRHFSVVPGISATAIAAGNSIAEERQLGGDTQYILNGTVAEPTTGRTSSTGGIDGHNHGLTIDSADNLPPYYALAYIMKA